MTSGFGAGQWIRQRGNRARARVLEIPLKKPVCLGRIDPKEGVYPDIDLTADLAMEFGVSREHACIYRRGNAIEVEDLASTNGTMLNGTRLSPYLSAPLKDGDQLQLGKLLIEVSFGANHRRDTTTEIHMAAAH
jgi:pSer/pThr/pTyr-binding forkhead associated (FHA) protein